MSNSFPRLPIEVVDSIIHDALDITTSAGDASNRSSYAQVGHLWRNRVNERRYRKLHLCMAGHTIAHLRALVDICTSKVWLPHEGVVRHVQGFTLDCGTKSSEGTCLDRAAVGDAAIATVLRSIFPDKSKSGRRTTASLSIVGHYCNTSRFHFDTFGPDIIAALNDIGRVAEIEKLALFTISGVPLDLISSPTLDSLVLKEVQFLLPDEEGPDKIDPHKCLLPKLDSIALQDSPSFVEWLTTEPRGPPPPLTTMTTTYETGNMDDVFYDALYRLGANLETLFIEVIGGFYDLCDPIDYNQVHVNERLSIDLDYNIDYDEKGEMAAERIPAFQTMTQFLPSIPPRELYIFFAVSIYYYDLPDSPRGCIEDVYEEIYHPSFPEYVERIASEAPTTSIDIVLSVSVHVDTGSVYQSPEVYDGHKRYLLERFTCLNGMSGIKFRIEMAEYDDMDLFRSGLPDAIVDR